MDEPPLVDVPSDAPLDERVEALMRVLGRAGEAGYIGEAVSQLEHGLQAAALAARRGDDELVLAALLHDIGHLADPTAASMEGFGAEAHEDIGHDVLLRLGFSRRVARLVQGHVVAKRYLARGEAYRSKLSAASARTLELQGGPMTDAEAAAFEADPLHADMVRLRAWDEAAKELDADRPGLAAYRELIAGHLRRER